jgi:transposase
MMRKLSKDAVEKSPAGGEEPVQILREFGVGIDTHSKFIAVCVIRKRGSALVKSEAQFSTDWPSLLAARQWITQALELPEGAPFWYCIESTGTYHFPVLLAFGGEPSVVNPLLAGPTRRKTDVLDARLLAHHSITGLWPASFIPRPEAQVLRVIWAERGEAQRAATRATNRINNTILRWGHTFAARVPVRSAQGLSMLEDLLEGRLPVDPGICPQGLPEAVRPVVKRLVESYRQFAAQARAAQKAAVDFVCATSWPTGKGMLAGRELLDLLLTVPGVGETTALTWLAEVCDPTRFQDVKQVAAYCGCDPSLKVSAGKVTEHVRRRGNTRLHFALRRSAQSVLSRPSERLGQWGLSIAGRHKKGGYRKACGAVSRRIAAGLWQVHMRAEPYDDTGYRYGQVSAVRKCAIEEMGLGRATELLKRCGYRDSVDVAEAYHRGALGAIAGLGDTTLARIRDWVAQNPRKRPYALTPAATMSETKTSKAKKKKNEK